MPPTAAGHAQRSCGQLRNNSDDQAFAQCALYAGVHHLFSTPGVSRVRRPVSVDITTVDAAKSIESRVICAITLGKQVVCPVAAPLPRGFARALIWTVTRQLSGGRQVCARFAPVLHHFFLEHYREPAAWFERRLAYTRATAVNSVAGYVLGLGDRHSHNILIHTRTAEAHLRFAAIQG